MFASLALIRTQVSVVVAGFTTSEGLPDAVVVVLTFKATVHLLGREDVGQRMERVHCDGYRVQFYFGVACLHLRKLAFQLVDLCLHCFLLAFRFLVDVLCVCQVVDHNLVLVVAVLQLEDVVSSTILVLLSLLEDAESLHGLLDLVAADLVLDLVDLNRDVAQVLHQFSLVSWVLLQTLKARLNLLPLSTQSVRICICFFNVAI